MVAHVVVATKHFSAERTWLRLSLDGLLDQQALSQWADCIVGAASEVVAKVGESGGPEVAALAGKIALTAV